MGCGSVVIAYDVPFNREVLGRWGLFFRNAASLKKAIEKLENMNSRWLERIRSGNRKSIKRRYNWDNIAERYFKLFGWVYERTA
jgi:glycosyltransferase involved in cell wall biosynthesis